MPTAGLSRFAPEGALPAQQLPSLIDLYPLPPVKVKHGSIESISIREIMDFRGKSELSTAQEEMSSVVCAAKVFAALHLASAQEMHAKFRENPELINCLRSTDELIAQKISSAIMANISVIEQTQQFEVKIESFSSSAQKKESVRDALLNKLCDTMHNTQNETLISEFFSFLDKSHLHEPFVNTWLTQEIEKVVNERPASEPYSIDRLKRDAVLELLSYSSLGEKLFFKFPYYFVTGNSFVDQDVFRILKILLMFAPQKYFQSFESGYSQEILCCVEKADDAELDELLHLAQKVEYKLSKEQLSILQNAVLNRPDFVISTLGQKNARLDEVVLADKADSRDEVDALLCDEDIGLENPQTNNDRVSDDSIEDHPSTADLLSNGSEGQDLGEGFVVTQNIKSLSSVDPDEVNVSSIIATLTKPQLIANYFEGSSDSRENIAQELVKWPVLMPSDAWALIHDLFENFQRLNNEPKLHNLLAMHLALSAFRIGTQHHFTELTEPNYLADWEKALEQVPLNFKAKLNEEAVRFIRSNLLDPLHKVAANTMPSASMASLAHAP